MRTTEKKINERILSELRKREMSQAELARRADIQHGYLNELLNLKKEKRWNVETLEKVAESLSIPVWQFFIDPNDVIPPEYLALMENYQRLEGVRKQIVDDAFTAAGAEQQVIANKSRA